MSLTTSAGRRSAGRSLLARMASLAATTALVLPGLAVPASAQSFSIDDGETVTVPSAEQPSPWNIDGNLTIGDFGSGELTITGGGEVTNQVGVIAVRDGSQGTVTVTGSGSTWTNTVDLIVGDTGTGILTISDGGTVINGTGFIGTNLLGTGSVVVTGEDSEWVNQDLIQIGMGSLILANGGKATVVGGAGTVNIAEFSGSGSLIIGAGFDDDDNALAPAGAGTLDAASVAFGAGDGRLVFNHTGNPDGSAHEFGAGISGDGAIGHLAGETVLTGDSSGFLGMTSVTGGRLVVANALGGSALVGNGGTLAGSGTIGSGAGSLVTIADGGTLTPGNSIGTLYVDGNLVLEAGSRYAVEVMPGGSEADMVVVSGTATINGGSLAHVGMTGTYDATQTYIILTAADGLTEEGTFGSVTSDFAFLDVRLDYGTNDITMTLERNDIDFGSIGQTPNQIATATGLDSLGFGSDVYDAVVQLDEATARTAFDLLSGEIHASVQTGLIENVRHIRDVANHRIRAAFKGIGTTPVPVLGYGTDGPALAPVGTGHGLAAWGSVFGSWGHTAADGNAGRVERNTGGFLVGADGLVADTWRIGLLAGYSRSDIDLDARLSSADMDSYHLGLYGGTGWELPGRTVSLRGGLAYSWHDIETSRSVGFLGFGPEVLSADYDAGSFQAFGELGYGIETATARLEPFISLAHVRTRTGQFAETGGAAALTVSGNTMDTTFTTIGIRGETGIELGGFDVRLSGMLGWRHAMGDTTPVSDHSFTGADGFTIAGSAIARNSAVIDAGFAFDLTPDATLGIAYQGQFASDARDHGLRANLAVRF